MTAFQLPQPWLPSDARPDSFESNAQENFDAIALALGELLGRFFAGSGSPEGVVRAQLGAVYVDRTGGSGTTLYVKEADAGMNTGWSAK